MEISVTSNWTSDNGLQISEIIQESDNLPSGDLVDLLEENKCISLENNTHEQGWECTIELTSKSPSSPWEEIRCDPVSIQHDIPHSQRKCLNGIIILSEARVCEIFIGPHHEYLKTVHGKLMGDFGDSKIYVCEINFNKPQDIVILKLKSLCLEDSLWIYGFHIAVRIENQTMGAGRGGHFSGDHLSSVLKDKGVHMSKQAIRFRQVLEGFNSGNSVDNKAMGFMSLMFGGTNTRPTGPKSNESELGIDIMNGNKRDESIDICSNGKSMLHMSDLLGAFEKRLSTESGERLGNGPINKEKETLCNNQNFGKDLGLSNNGVGENDRNLTSSEDILDKLKNMSFDNSRTMKESSNFGSLMEMLSKSVPVAKPFGDSQSCNVAQGGEKCVTLNGEAGCKCVSDTETIVNNVGKIVDEKLAAMEERLLKKIEQKFEEKASEDAQRLKRIEELFSKIYDKL